MVQIAVIADDLTGAADTGVQFRPNFGHMLLTSYRLLRTGLATPFHPSPEALAVFTNSRSLGAESARQRLRETGSRVVRLEPAHIYKKVDSCLRGNLGAEVEALMEETGDELSFIAPAFPRMGRTTLHDTHLLNGVPTTRTELSRDPTVPVTEHHLSRTVASQCRRKVGHIDIQFLEDTEERLLGEIDRLVRSGVIHLTFDAAEQGHLDRVAHIAFHSPRKILLVGSAGLAESLGAQFPVKPLKEESRSDVPREGYHLLVCGTASGQTKKQIAALVQVHPYEVIHLEPGLLADPDRRGELLKGSHAACAALSRNHTILCIGSREASSGRRPEKPDPRIAERIVDGLGRFVTSALTGVRPASLFLTGGDTADAVLNHMGARGIRLHGEIVPGMVRGTLMGGALDGLPVVTKAGTFGGEDTLLELHRYWRTGKGGRNHVH